MNTNKVITLVLVLAITACSVSPPRPVSSDTPTPTSSPRVDSPGVTPPDAAPHPTCTVIGEHVNVREKPTMRSRVVIVANEGDELTVLERTNNGWLKVQAGYIYRDYCKE